MFEALNLKNIEFEYRPVNILRKDGGEQVSFYSVKFIHYRRSLFQILFLKYSKEFTKLNPKQEVPALLIDGHLLVQSVYALYFTFTIRP